MCDHQAAACLSMQKDAVSFLAVISPLSIFCSKFSNLYFPAACKRNLVSRLLWPRPFFYVSACILWYRVRIIILNYNSIQTPCFLFPFYRSFMYTSPCLVSFYTGCIASCIETGCVDVVNALTSFIWILTFIGPCIVIYFYSKTNQMLNISNLFYFGTTLYMFRTVSPSIIRSLRLYIQQQVYVIQVLWLLASNSRVILHCINL
jgi:hypothetical protein